MSSAESSAPASSPSLPPRQFDCRGGRYLRVDRLGLVWRVAYYEPRPTKTAPKHVARFSCADRDLGFAVARVLADADSDLFLEPLILYVRNVMGGEL